MASTYTQLLYHLVFSTKGRIPLITAGVREPLYRYMSGIVRRNGGSLMEIGGIEDHVHCLARIPARIAVSHMLQMLKSDSSAWMNGDEGPGGFAWQVGYGAFTVSPSQVPQVRRYIRRQVEHHRRVPFEKELVELLEKHEIEYDRRYVFD